MGFAAFENRNALVDWGAVSLVSLKTFHLRRARVVHKFHADLVVLGFSSNDFNESHRRTWKEFTQQIGAQSAVVRVVNKLAVKVHFARHGHETKQDIARLIVQDFPALAWHLPRNRKPWQDESASQVVFDAVALGIYAFDHLSP